MRYRIVSAIFTIFVAYNAYSAELFFSQKTIAKGQILRGEFTDIRKLEGFTKPLNSQGHFVVVPGAGVIWYVETPLAITTIIKPNALVQKVNDNQTLNLPAERMSFLAHLYDMLNGTLLGDWS